MGALSVESAKYSREDLLECNANIPEVSSLFAPGWQPGHVNGEVSRGWGKSAESHPAPQEPDVCWDLAGSVKPVGTIDMTLEEKEVRASNVNSHASDTPLHCSTMSSV